MHVNISDTARGAVFPPTLRSTPQDWTHPKAQLCTACPPHSCSLYCVAQIRNPWLHAAELCMGRQQQQHQANMLLFTAAVYLNADWGTHVQVIWIDVGALAWLSTDSNEFYIDMALKSRDSRYDGKRPRIRVTAGPIWHIHLDAESLGLLPSPSALSAHAPDNMQQPYWLLLYSYGAAWAHEECGQRLCTVTAGMLTVRLLLLR